ncbi:hypothetical protein GXP67_02800 [Rhodocytophaga rosea]|uniref:Uncharacterized protein n=1 Tax=Rhodocytophaga rosea TaxID=2704465 RepID=A0A6C0GCF4_9BACT|nr:hypothetical protein [Rhodocytophaga rosea]QHT65669.1 hypothetical protein GXP67_02800 [Rhodocytophaga rosea]
MKNHMGGPYKWKSLKIHSPDDVVKAGGADAYARQIGHIPAKEWPTIDFTDEEWAQIEEMMKNDK